MSQIAAVTGPTIGGRAILVVEDDVLIRALICDALRDAGALVIEAESADEALRCLAAGPAVDVVFTDVRMPGSMDGLQMLDLVASDYPCVKTVITSGHLLPREVPHGTLFFRKPYLIEHVVAQLVRLVGLAANEQSDNG